MMGNIYKLLLLGKQKGSLPFIDGVEELLAHLKAFRFSL